MLLLLFRANSIDEGRLARFGSKPNALWAHEVGENMIRV
jgi:hypothetical protein